jgi:hypothetical protein
MVSKFFEGQSRDVRPLTLEAMVRVLLSKSSGPLRPGKMN